MEIQTKNYTYKNRGMVLEKIINDSNSYYLQIDKAIIYKKPTPIKVLNVSYPSKKSALINKAVFENISTLDYNGLYKGFYIEFDAKECKSNTSFPISNIKNHQIEHIKRIIKHKGIAFLIIMMNNKFFLLKGETLLEFLKEEKRKSIPYNYLEKDAYLIKEKFNPRLDYLEVIEQIYFMEGKE